MKKVLVGLGIATLLAGGLAVVKGITGNQDVEVDDVDVYEDEDCIVEVEEEIVEETEVE